MKKTRSFTKVKMRRFLAVVFALVMVLSGISVPAVKADADTGVNYKSILGDARYYGVLAQEFYQKNHTQTNYAVVTFRNPAGDIGMAIPNEPDLVQGNNIPFCAAHIPGGNWVRFGQSTYYKKRRILHPVSPSIFLTPNQMREMLRGYHAIPMTYI